MIVVVLVGCDGLLMPEFGCVGVKAAWTAAAAREPLMALLQPRIAAYVEYTRTY